MKNIIFLLYGLLFLPVGGAAQHTTTPTLTLTTIEHFKQQAHSVAEIAPQKILSINAFFLRFPELGVLYNPNFPATRNKVHCVNFQKKGTNLLYLGSSVSTNRATVPLKGRVGEFYGIWQGGTGKSLIEYEVTRNGTYLDITGKLYQCARAMDRITKTK